MKIDWVPSEHLKENAMKILEMRREGKKWREIKIVFPYHITTLHAYKNWAVQDEQAIDPDDKGVPTLNESINEQNR